MLHRGGGRSDRDLWNFWNIPHIEFKYAICGIFHKIHKNSTGIACRSKAHIYITVGERNKIFSTQNSSEGVKFRESSASSDSGVGATGRSSGDASKVITNILGFRGNTSLGGLMGSKLGQFQDKKGC